MNLDKNNFVISDKIKNVANDMARKMPSVNIMHTDPINTLSVDDISYLQTYLAHIKLQKINQNKSRQDSNIKINRANDIYDPLNRHVPTDWKDYSTMSSNQNRNVNNINLVAGSRGSTATRTGKKCDLNFGQTNDYYNPYEYGSRQNSLGSVYKETYTGPYNNDPQLLNKLGISNDNCQQELPNHIRNINVESSLLQREMTHLPGQREITEKEIDRFQLLPFDPQDHRHIVWEDNMPRGGYATRSDRLELNL